jgi:hypothetical protein
MQQGSTNYEIEKQAADLAERRTLPGLSSMRGSLLSRLTAIPDGLTSAFRALAPVHPPLDVEDRRKSMPLEIYAAPHFDVSFETCALRTCELSSSHTPAVLCQKE